jgi:hypothetical protein
LPGGVRAPLVCVNGIWEGRDMAMQHKKYADVQSRYEAPPKPRHILLVSPGKDTLIAARDQVRRMIAEGDAEGGIRVVLEEGEYRLTQTLHFDERDSGTAYAPVVWTAQQGKKALISGGVRLPAEGFSAVSTGDPLYNRLPMPEQTLVMDLRAHGIESAPYEGGFGQAYAGEDKVADQNMIGNSWPEVFWGDRVLDLVRYPGDDYLLTARSEGRERDKAGDTSPHKIGFGYDDSRINGWLEPEKAWMQGYFYYDWANALVRVGQVDRANRRIESAAEIRYGVRNNMRYYFLNVPEELNVPGQYYLDSDHGRLYILPPEGFASKPLYLSHVKDALFRFDNASHMHVCGMRFSYARGSGVLVFGGDGIAVEGCELCNLGYAAVILGCQRDKTIHYVDRIGNGGVNHIVRSCDIWNTGFGGVSVAAGNRETLEACGIRIENCDIHDFGRLGKCYFFGVSLSSVGVVVSNNRFHAGPHAAIWFDGNDNVIEYNEFYDLLREADDAAAVYCGRDYTMGGNVIRYNYFHDMKSNAKAAVGVFGTYCDDNSASLAYYGNIYHHMQGVHHSHGGHDIVFENNLIVNGHENSKYSVTLHGYGYADEFKSQGMHADLFDRAPTETPLWRSRFPRLYEYSLWEPGVQAKPHYCVYRNNAIVNHQPLSINFDWDDPDFKNVIENNVQITGDAGFVDEQGLDLRLREDSVVYERIPEFLPIPFEKMGLYRDDYRE